MKTEPTITAEPSQPDRAVLQAAAKRAAAERNQLMGSLHNLKATLQRLTEESKQRPAGELANQIEAIKKEISDLEPQVQVAIGAYDKIAAEIDALDAAALNAQSDANRPATALPQKRKTAKDILQGFVTLVDRALARSPRRSGWELTAAAVLDSSGKHDLILKDFSEEVNQLRELQIQYDRADKVVHAYTPEAAKEAWLDHREKKLQPAIHDGKMDEHDSWSRAEWEADFMERGEAARDERRRICELARPLCYPIAKRFVKIARAVADDMEDAQIVRYENYGLEYPGPDAVVQAIRRAADVALARVDASAMTAAPANMVPYLNIF